MSRTRPAAVAGRVVVRAVVVMLAVTVSVTAALLSSAAAGAASVEVVRCPTQKGTPGALPRTPSRLTVARRARGLLAYTNSESYLLAPPGMRCSGLAATDGGSVLMVWPKGSAGLARGGSGAGLTLEIDPACAGCKAEDACPFFTGYAASLGFPCTPPRPVAGERVVRPRQRLALFEDPPGVSGDGWPSGGPFAANGVAGYTPAPDGGVVYRATCTLPTARRADCTASLDDVIGRYG